jgi:hypothetical protein
MIKKGDINPEKLIDMNSAQRREFFGKHFGEENAQRLNLGVERKLILKNQQQGLVTWAKHTAGLGPKAKRDLISRVEKMEDVLTPENEDAFLEDLAAQALGTSVSMEEAGNIAALGKEVRQRREAMEAGPRRKLGGKPTKTELEYGRALVAFDNYMTTLKLESEGTLSERAQAKLDEYKENPFHLLGDTLKTIFETAREARTSWDNSFMGKQGRNLFFKGMTGSFQARKAWWDTFKRSHKVLWETFAGRGREVMDELRAEIVSDPDFDLMQKGRVATSVVEEEAPAEWVGEIPYLGKPFGASHNAFTASAHMLRYRTAQYYFHIAREAGVDLTDKNELLAIGGLVNALTGRGEFGKLPSDKPGVLNNVFFSPRLIAADFHTLTAHRVGKTSKFVKKEAAKNLMQIIVAQAIILAIADLIDDDAVEWDWRSADFGKIKVGNTRFDVSGGMGVMLRLAARLAPLLINKDAYYKNSKGKLVKLNQEGWGKRTGLDLAEDYLQNKTAPAMSVLLAHLEGNYRFKDEKPSFTGDIRELYLPLTVDNILELKNDDESANMLTAALADAYGLFTQTYGPKKKVKQTK